MLTTKPLPAWITATQREAAYVQLMQLSALAASTAAQLRGDQPIEREEATCLFDSVEAPAARALEALRCYRDGLPQS